MSFRVESIKQIHIDKGEDNISDRWETRATNREGDRIIIISSDWFGLNPDDEIEIRKISKQSTIVRTE